MQDAAGREAVASKGQWRISQELGAMRSIDETNQDISSVNIDGFYRQQVVFSSSNFQQLLRPKCLRHKTILRPAQFIQHGHA